MASSDIDRNATKPADGQLDFSGGMDWISDAAKAQPNTSRLLVNVDIRNGNAEKAKGQQPLGPLEVGAKYYDRFNSASLSDKWSGFTTSDGTIATSTSALVLTGVTSSNAWDTVGVVAQEQFPKATGSYVEFTLTTPTGPDSDSRFRMGISGDSTALDTDSGVEVEFDENLDILLREASSETDTTVNWVATTKYRIRVEKLATGYQGYLVDLTNAEHTAVQLFASSVAGNVDGYLELQAYGSAWTIDDVVIHEGFGSTGSRIAPNGLFRFYKETDENETIVCAHGIMYKYTTSEGYTKLAEGFDDTAIFKFRVFNDELYAVNGVDVPVVYNSLNVQTVGAGSTQAPVADSIETHLQSLFMLQGNSLYRNTVGNTRTWDPLSPLVDIDSWNGDVGKGMVKLGSNLYIIKSASVWELIGNQNNNFVLRRVLGSRGCVAPNSIATNGQVAFWRGPDGVYRFDGVKTTLVSFRIRAAFDSRHNSEFPTTIPTKATESVGVIHDFKYRLSVVQYGETDLTYNNFEYVYDMLADRGEGGWAQRSNRAAGIYSSWDGEGDANELVYTPSDTSNALMLGEIDNGNYRNTYSNISLIKKSDVDFPGRIVSRKLIGRGTVRDFLDKSWQDIMVLYEPKSKVRLGFTSYTKYNTAGTLKGFVTNNSMSSSVLDGASFSLDGESELYQNSYLEEKTDNKKFGRIASDKNKNKGSEFWFEIKQDAAVRAIATEGFTAITGTGLLTNVGNFEPFSIKRVIVRFTEENH